jgi:cytochrome b561
VLGLNWSFALTRPHPQLSYGVKEAREFLGRTIYSVIGMHAAAALWHHFVFRSDALPRASIA